MTDTPSSTPPSPGPSEVPISPSQTQTPIPVGPQAGQKPPGEIEGSRHRPESRRETIQKAFEKADKQATPAKSGTETKQPRHEAKPEAKPEPKAPQQYREGGRFARAPDQPQGDQQQQPQQQQPKQAGQQPQRPALPEGAPYREPPPRMGDHAKAEWAGTPESVRGEVARMHHEFGEAYKRYRGDHETMNSIRHFHDLATQHGTTLDRALTNYVGMENKLRQDLIGGLDVIVSNLNLRTPDGQKLSLRDVAYHILNRSPEQHSLTAQQNAQNSQGHQIGQLHQMVNSLAQSMRQMHFENRFRQTRGTVDEFADQHPRFDELSDLIEQELKLGFDLNTAYQRAELLRPADPAAQTRNSAHAAQTRDPSAQTRPVDRSISGSPDGSTPPDTAPRRKNGKPPGRREVIQHAFRKAGANL